MTSATSTPALLPGSPAPEGLAGQSDPAVGGRIFASLLSQAVLRPGVESPRVALVDTASDETPGPQTQRAPGKGPRRQDQDSEASQMPCWLPDLLTASCQQPSPGAGGCVPSAPVSTAAPAGGDKPLDEKGPDSSPGPQPDESATAAGGLLLASGSFCAKAVSRAEVVEQFRAAAAKDSTAEPADCAAAPKASPATRLEPGSAPETRAEALPPANLASVENEGMPAQPSTGPIPGAVTTGTGLTAPDAGSSRERSESGMSVASDTGAMLAPREVNENACQAEQNLPVSVAGSELPQGAGRERKAGVAAWEAAAAMPAGGAEGALAVAGHSAGDELTAHPEPLRPHAGAADAVGRAIDGARAGLERAQAASVRLVLRPDANTQLALHIKWQQGHFEALAVVERGDFAALGAGWTQLQSRLAEQGVRLAPLVSSLEFSRSFLGGQSSSARQERPAEQNLPAVEELKQLPSSRRGTSKPGHRNRSSGSQREWWA